jgi:hypothetical protein
MLYIHAGMRVFVIMPFGNPALDIAASQRYTSIYSKWIKKAVESLEDPDSPGATIQCDRADATVRPGSVIDHVIEQLADADIVIADLTTRNANVFYELGVRHALSANTILIAEREEDVPFDLRPLRTIFYRYDPDGMLELRDAIIGAVREIIADRTRVDNPVRRFLIDRETRRLASASAPPGYDALREVLSEVSRMRNEVVAETVRIQSLLRAVLPSRAPASGAHGDLSDLVGVWREQPGRSLFVGCLVEGEFLMPYAYTRAQELDAHFYDFRRVGELLLARFAWFDASITGYGMFKVESPEKLSGGWWYGSQLPEKAWQDGALADGAPFMNDLNLIRDRNATEPLWLEDYLGSKRKQQWRPDQG